MEHGNREAGLCLWCAGLVAYDYHGLLAYAHARGNPRGYKVEEACMPGSIWRVIGI